MIWRLIPTFMLILSFYQSMGLEIIASSYNNSEISLEAEEGSHLTPNNPCQAGEKLHNGEISSNCTVSINSSSESGEMSISHHQQESFVPNTWEEAYWANLLFRDPRNPGSRAQISRAYYQSRSFPNNLRGDSSEHPGSTLSRKKRSFGVIKKWKKGFYNGHQEQQVPHTIINNNNNFPDNPYYHQNQYGPGRGWGWAPQKGHAESGSAASASASAQSNSFNHEFGYGNFKGSFSGSSSSANAQSQSNANGHSHSKK